MNLEQIKSIVVEYLSDTLKYHESCAHETDMFPLGVEQALQHAVWMCEKILLMNDEAKAMRWLCFIQGILWMTNKRTIDEMRDDNR